MQLCNSTMPMFMKKKGLGSDEMQLALFAFKPCFCMSHSSTRA